MLYPFGHGLSSRRYTATLDRAQYTVSAAAVQKGANVTVVVKVTAAAATTPMPGSRSALLFLSQKARDGALGESSNGDPLPQRKEWLADFDKVRFEAAEGEATLALHVGADALGRWVPKGGARSTNVVEGAYTVEPGVYTVRVTDSVSTATLTVTP